MDTSFACLFNRPSTWLRFASFKVLTIGFIFAFTAQQNMATEAAWRQSLAVGDSKLSSRYVFQAENNYKHAIQQLVLVVHRPEDEARCLSSFANVLALENKTDDAIATYKKALSLLEESYGKSSAKILPILFVLGSIYESAGDHDLAVPYYRRAIAINESHYGQFCPTFANKFSHDQIVDKLNKSFAGDKYNKTTASILTKQPGLQSSEVLRDLLSNYKKDMLNKDYNSDQELTSIFNQEITREANKGRDNNIASDSYASSSVRQPEAVKRSRRI